MAALRPSHDRETRLTGNRLQATARTLPASSMRTCALAIVLASVVAPGVVHGQKKGDKVRVLAGSAMRAAPGGQVIGVLSRAYESSVEMVEGTAIRLRINGYVDDDVVRLESNRARGVVSGSGGDGATLRTGPSAKEPALATLMKGAVVFSGPRSANFLPVNRVVWIDKSRLARYSAPPAATPRPAAGSRTVEKAADKPTVAQARPVPVDTPSKAPTPKPTPAGLPPMQLMTGSPLRVSPNGDVISAIPAGTIVSPIASENGWTRVRVEGWLPTKDLADASAKAAGELSAAEIRADPAGTKGKTVRWTVEALSFQTGDELRRELTGAPYLLVRGPGNERAILYLAVPDSLVAAARALAPLSTITVTARVRNGRSEPGGVPILDLVELIRR